MADPRSVRGWLMKASIRFAAKKLAGPATLPDNVPVDR
jgi:hypothetical protein